MKHSDLFLQIGNALRPESKWSLLYQELSNTKEIVFIELEQNKDSYSQEGIILMDSYDIAFMVDVSCQWQPLRWCQEFGYSHEPTGEPFISVRDITICGNPIEEEMEASEILKLQAYIQENLIQIL